MQSAFDETSVPLSSPLTSFAQQDFSHSVVETIAIDAEQAPAEQHDDFSPSAVSEVNEVEPLQPQASHSQSVQVHVSPSQHPQPASHWPQGQDDAPPLRAGEAVNVAAAKNGIAT
ncbi:hypothetical protein [Rubripirellula obstinata]|uniref:hypothetical protein n=1 Tax=Rubripirellula obstinata TaxID=406547 RepID=UPI00122D041C|nr:hypothetical protein [Rubripirellula obstinata]